MKISRKQMIILGSILFTVICIVGVVGFYLVSSSKNSTTNIMSPLLKEEENITKIDIQVVQKGQVVHKVISDSDEIQDLKSILQQSNISSTKMPDKLLAKNLTMTLYVYTDLHNRKTIHLFNDNLLTISSGETLSESNYYQLKDSNTLLKLQDAYKYSGSKEQKLIPN